MFNITKPGIYKISGKDQEFLVNIAGDFPFYRITSIINLTKALETGKFEPVTESSREASIIAANLEEFVVIDIEVNADLTLLPKTKSTKFEKVVLNENYVHELVTLYRREKSIPGRGDYAFEAFLMKNTNYSYGQIKTICNKIRQICK